MAGSIIQVGRNCWRHESAERVALLVDAADYFAALYDALHRAQQSVSILGWDIHSKTPLLPSDDDRGPAELADVLHEITVRNDRLRVRILIWDPAPIYVLEREFAPLLRFSFRTGRNVRLRFANDHAVGAAHHQKVVVIDDRLAFAGGVDLTAGRWDTREHKPDDPRRTDPWGRHYRPFHDAQIAVDGDAARALGELARQRWLEATGEQVEATDATDDPWPDSLEPHLRRVKVAFARTQPTYKERPAVREVADLFRDSIAAAQKFIYIENQYVTSTMIRNALASRLAEPDGPEVIIVTPRQQAGRLADLTMGALRVRIVRELQEVDRHSRLRVFYPVVGGDVPVNLHAKIMVIDDVLLRIGSANLSNRSMGLDTECDAAIEADGDENVRERIRDFRDGLLAEHLGTSVDTIRSEAERCGSLLKAVDALRGSERALEDLSVEPRPEYPMIDSLVADPEQPIEETLAKRVIPEEAVEQGRRRLPRVVLALAITLVVAGVAAWWLLEGWPEAEQFANALEPLQEKAWGPPLAAMFMAVGTLLMLPVNAFIVAVVFVFGPWMGAAVSMAGSLVSAGGAYGVGRVLWRDTVRRLAGKRVNRLSHELANRGITAIVALRLLPVAPFTISNLVAGSSRIGFRDFMLGTFIGMTPGILILAFASDRVIAAARHPDAFTILQAVVAVVVLAAGSYWLYRFLKRHSNQRAADEPEQH